MPVKVPETAGIPELVELAESSVAAVKDPELRKIAFGKVLDSLLVKRHTSDPSRQANSSTPKQKSKAGPSAYIEDLCAEGFFKKAATLADVRRELVNRGHSIPLTSLSGPMQRLCKRKVLRRQRATVNGKESFVYSNW